MANVLEYAKVFNDNLDKLIEQNAATAWMEANASRVKYNGGNEFKLAKITLDGLTDYDRANGFDTGAATLDWETKSFKYDRGRKFRLDAMDVDETNFVLDASTLMGEFTRTKVIPEVDMVRIADLAGFGTKVDANAKGAEATLKDLIVKVRNEGYDGQIVAQLTFEALREIEDGMATKLGTIDVNGISFPALGDVALVPTVSNRMVSKVKKNTTTKAFEKDAEAVDIGILVTGLEVPLGIMKHNVNKIIVPEVNQEADAWDIHYRAYHTLEVKDNEKPIVFYAEATPTV